MSKNKIAAEKVFAMYCSGDISLNELVGMINSLAEYRYGGYTMSNGTRVLRIVQRDDDTTVYISNNV